MAATDPTRRIFVAVDLDDEVRHALAAHLNTALGDAELPGRAAPPANWHVTLRFLGRLDPVTCDRLLAALDEAPLGAPFPIRFGGLGAFPRPSRATVLWLAVEAGAAELVDLAASVERAVVEIGLEPGDRPFHPHLTLSRIRPARTVAALVDDTPPFPGRQPVRAVTVFESLLGNGPAVYRPLESFPLSGPPSLQP